MTGNVFKTFYILYKSNAKDVIKDNEAAEKSGKNLEQSLKRQKEEAAELGKEFTKIVEGLTSAVTAYVSFGAIKTGIFNAEKFNTALERTHETTGQNVRDIAVYGAALGQFGGSAEDFQTTLRSMTQAAAEQGRQLPPLAGFLRQLNREFQGLSLNESSRRAGLLGITDPAMLNLLRQTTQQFDMIIDQQNQLVGITGKGTAAAQEFDRAWKNVSTAFTGVFSTIGEDVFPGMTGLLNIMAQFGKFMQGDSLFSVSFLGALGTGLTALSAVIVRALIPSLLGIEVAAAPLLAFLAPLAALLAGVAVTTGVIDYFSKEKGSTATTPKNGGPVNSKALEFWMNQGYSRDQAAGWAANEQRESSGNPGARNGNHFGLYQWSSARRAKILAGVGIDVATASADDQRRAAAWEAQESGIADKVKAAGSSGAAASIINQQFEIPGTGMALARESYIRSIMAAKIAISGADSSPYSSTGSISNVGGDRNTTVHIDKVEVATHATDAESISSHIAQGLQSHIQTAISNSDDGVAM